MAWRALTVGALLLAGLPAMASADEVTLGSNFYCPLNCEPGSGKPGFMAELAAAALAENGHKLKYVLLPWARAVDDTKAGIIDGVFGALAETYADEMILGAEPYALWDDSFVVRQGVSFNWAGPASLKGMIIGYPLGYQYFPELQTYIDALRKTPAVKVFGEETSVDAILKALAGGEIDVFVESSMALKYSLSHSPVAGLVAIAASLNPTGSYLGLTKAKPRSLALAAQFDDAIRKRRANGELARILARYGVEDWQPVLAKARKGP